MKNKKQMIRIELTKEEIFMGEVLQFVSMELYQQESKGMKSGQTKVIYQDEQRKIKLMKQGRSIYNIIVNYGNTPIEEIAKNLLVQA